jgi:cell shape-determining protein MreC
MKKKSLTILIVLVVLIVLALVWLGGREAFVPGATSPVDEPADAVEQVSPGTTITDIESDLNLLSEEEGVLGDLEAELRQLEEELEAGL